MVKQCILEDKQCINCKKCLVCDLDPSKLCNNCCKCIDNDETNFNTVKIDDIIE